jgi:predicted GNAT family acetyltransferase
MITEFYEDIELFYDHVYSFLIEREAENNLIFSILNAIKLNPNVYGDQFPLLVLVKDNGRLELISIQTPPFKLVLSYTDNLQSIDTLIISLIQKGIELPGVLGPKDVVQRFINLWSENRNVTPKLATQERIYKLIVVSDDTLGERKVIQSTKKNQSLIIKWAKDFITEAFPESIEEHMHNMEKRLVPDIDQGRFFLLLENDKIVSIARKAGKTPNGNIVNFVYTPPALRRRGYATECVANLSKHILEEGNQFCFLFTDLANPISNSIYQKIGYKPIIDVDEYSFLLQ